MKRFSLLIQLKFIYMYVLLYLIIGYFYDSKIKMLGYYDILEQYFGNFIVFMIFILMLHLYSLFIKCKRNRMVYGIRLNFFVILGISTVFLGGLYNLGLPFKKIVADEVVLENSIRMFLYQYKLGTVLTYSFNYCISNIYFNYFYVSLYVLIFISLFFLIAKKLRVTITSIIVHRREEKRRRIEKQLIQEQIELMEAMERREREQKILEEEKEKVEDDTSI